MHIKNLVTLITLLLAILSATACSSTAEQESTGEFFDSSLITAKIKARLVDDPVTSAFNIKVNTYKGKVQLSGFVNNPAEKQRAGLIAEQVEGVKTVINDLIVKQK